jgi:hypothetical protein
MTLEKQPFRRYTEGEKPKYDAFTIWLNEEERKELEYCKILLRQPKDSTALKTLAHACYLDLIGSHSIRWLLGVVAKNSYNNKKTGVVVEDPKKEDPNGNPGENLTD